MAEKLSYQSAGVDNNLKEKCSRLFYEASRKTWENRKGRIGEIQSDNENFSGFRCGDISNLPNAVCGMGNDGIGTKMVIGQRLSSFTGDYSYHRGAMHDLFDMVVDDTVVRGAEPVWVNWTINFNKPHLELARYLAEGSVEAARLARVSIFSGETADLGDVVGGFGEERYIADATVFWIADKSRAITGRNVKAGDRIVMFKEEGFRSNGLRLVRMIGEQVYGENWHEKEVDGLNLAKLALTPSRIYCAGVVDMFGGYNMQPRANVKAVAHITGGGIFEKMKRILLPSGLGAVIYNQFEPSPIMQLFQRLGKVDDLEMYNTWNAGNGMAVITNEPDKVISIAREHGIDAKDAGLIIEAPIIRIKNMGVQKQGEFLPSVKVE